MLIRDVADCTTRGKTKARAAKTSPAEMGDETFSRSRDANDNRRLLLNHVDARLSRCWQKIARAHTDSAA